MVVIRWIWAVRKGQIRERKSGDSPGGVATGMGAAAFGSSLWGGGVQDTKKSERQQKKNPPAREKKMSCKKKKMICKGETQDKRGGDDL